MPPNVMIDRAWSPIDYTQTTWSADQTLAGQTGTDARGYYEISILNPWGVKICRKFLYEIYTCKTKTKQDTDKIQGQNDKISFKNDTKCIIYTLS